MKPDWDKLMKEYSGHDSVLIADVDCTAGGKELCNSVGVRGYPTIKHGDPNNMEDYKGGRTLKDLQTFAKENLGPTCGPANLDLCDDAKKEQINKFLAMSASDLQAAAKEKEDEMKKAEKDFEEFVKGLQASYEKANKEKDDTLAKIKESGLGLMKSVIAHQGKAAKGEL